MTATLRRLAVVVGILGILFSGALASPASAANFGAHVGLAEDVRNDRYFVAGALLADIDHFLPVGEPQTDSAAFAAGVVRRAWDGSARAWSLARGWIEHLDQDARFVAAVAAVQAAYPSYTVTDVRLGFDYWTLLKHPFATDFDFLLTDPEVHQVIAGGLLFTDAAGVRDAIDRLLYSNDPAAPGLFLQLTVARTFAAFYPQIVRDLEPFYDAFYAGAVAGYRDPFPALTVLLGRLLGAVRRMPTGLRGALEPLADQAMSLSLSRPAGWRAAVQDVLLQIRDRASVAVGPALGGRLAAITADLAWQIAESLEPPP